MVQENECLSYPKLQLTSVFFKEVLGNIQGTADNKSSSYPVFELPGVNCNTKQE